MVAAGLFVMLHVGQDLLLVGPGAGGQAQRAVNRPGALEQGRVLDHRQHTQRDAFAVVQARGTAAPHTAHGFDAVADGVAEVQAGADAALALVLLDDLFLKFQTSVNNLFNVILGVLALKQCKQLRVSDDAGLERLGQAVDDLTAGQGLERVKIDKHDLGLPECADDVLRLAQINRRLAADGGIHLRKHRRGAVDKVNAAHVAGRAEAAQIAHNAAADGHQQILAVHAERQHSLQNLTVDLQAFAALAPGDRVDGGIGALGRHGLRVLGGYAGVGQHKDLAVCHVRELMEVGKASGL